MSRNPLRELCGDPVGESGGVVSADSREARTGSTTIVDTSESWDGTALPSYPAGTPRITILRITIAPGERLAMHRHPVINAGVVLQGELTVVAENGLSKTFSAGSGIVELVNTFHYGENQGTVPAAFRETIRNGPEVFFRAVLCLFRNTGARSRYGLSVMK